MTLPPRRKPKRSGILREPKRVWLRHRRFVVNHECCIAGKGGHLCDGDIVPAHVRTETDGGGGLKPHDWWTISLCFSAHAEQHVIGEPAFERRYGIDMKRLAAEFAAKSPDVAMKAAMAEGD